MKAYGITAQELRDLVDAVGIIEAHTGERLLPHEVGDVLGYYCDDGNPLNYRGEEENARKINAAGALIAIALGDDRPEFRQMIEKAEADKREGGAL